MESKTDEPSDSTNVRRQVRAAQSERRKQAHFVKMTIFALVLIVAFVYQTFLRPKTYKMVSAPFVSIFRNIGKLQGEKLLEKFSNFTVNGESDFPFEEDGLLSMRPLSASLSGIIANHTATLDDVESKRLYAANTLTTFKVDLFLSHRTYEVVLDSMYTLSTIADTYSQLRAPSKSPDAQLTARLQDIARQAGKVVAAHNEGFEFFRSRAFAAALPKDLLMELHELARHHRAAAPGVHPAPVILLKYDPRTNGAIFQTNVYASVGMMGGSNVIVMSADPDVKKAMKKSGVKHIIYLPRDDALTQWRAIYVLLKEGLNLICVESHVQITGPIVSSIRSDFDVEINSASLGVWPGGTDQHIDELDGSVFRLNGTPAVLDFLEGMMLSHPLPIIQNTYLNWDRKEPLKEFLQHLHGAGLAAFWYRDEELRNEKDPQIHKDPKALKVNIMRVDVVAKASRFVLRRLDDFRPIFIVGDMPSPDYFHNQIQMKLFHDMRGAVDTIQNPKANYVSFNHPPDLNLADDMSAFVASLQVAFSMGRTLIAPSRMNCRNSPLWDSGLFNQSYGSNNCGPEVFIDLDDLATFQKDGVRLLVDSFSTTVKSFVDLLETSSERVTLFDKGNTVETLKRADYIAFWKEANPGGSARVLQIDDDPREVKKVFEKFEKLRTDQLFICRNAGISLVQGAFGKPLFDKKSLANAKPPSDCGLKGIDCCRLGGITPYFLSATGKTWDAPCNCGVSLSCAPQLRGMCGNTEPPEEHPLSPYGKEVPEEERAEWRRQGKYMGEDKADL